MEKIAVTEIKLNFPFAKTKKELWENLIAKKDNFEKINGCFVAKKNKLKINIKDLNIPSNISQKLSYHDKEVIHLVKSIKNNLSRRTSIFAVSNINKFIINSYIPYIFNYSGESVFLDTACSSSLTAVSYACRLLYTHETDNVLIIGSTVYKLKPNDQIGIISKKGECRPFDKDADGTLPGEGTAVIVLKRLKDAIKNQDKIFSIIDGYSINNDGHNKLGYYATSIKAQSENIKNLLKKTKTNRDEIFYIECHATGTKLGDIVEVEALNEIFNNRLYLGSIKANIGHLNHNAGIAGLIKAILILKHQVIPGQMHYNAMNDLFIEKKYKFIINKDIKILDSDCQKAIVASLGMGGNNVHVLVSKYIDDLEKNKKYTRKLQNIEVIKNRASLHYDSFSLLLNIWKNILLIDEAKITPELDFFEIGGDSIKYIEMLLQVKRKTNINEQELTGKTKFNEILNVLNGYKEVCNKNYFIYNEREEKKTIVIIYPIIGSIACYNNLIKFLKKKNRVICIYNYNIIEKEKSINDICKKYVNLVKKYTSEKELYLLGWSYGGNLAYELGIQLNNAGKKITSIIMLDSWGIVPIKELNISSLLNRQLKNRKLNIETNISKLTKPILNSLIIKRLELCSIYFKEKPYTNIDIFLFKAINMLPEYDIENEKYNYWSDKAKKIKVELLDCNHEEILDKENLKIIIEKLRELYEL